MNFELRNVAKKIYTLMNEEEKNISDIITANTFNFQKVFGKVGFG